MVVEIYITNKSSIELSVLDSYYKLLLGYKKYETISSASIYFGEKSLLFKEINLVLVFDITNDVATNHELQL